MAGKPYTPKRFTKHGLSNSPEYRSWGHMLDRCVNPNNPAYADYGGRGIKVCGRWHSFANFYADMGSRPSPEHTLDRHPNNDGNYEPENCRWTTRAVQNRNKRNSRLVVFNGQQMNIEDACELAGLSASTVSSRINRYGWSIERALSTPARRMRRTKRAA